MPGKFRTLSQLREVILGMEMDLGLDGLASSERDLLYAIYSLFVNEAVPVRTESLREHVLLRNMPPATFHRSLRNLLHLGFVELASGRKVGAYVPRRHLKVENGFSEQT